MVALTRSGAHFREPWQFLPRARISADYVCAGSAATLAQFFTNMATAGFQDTTNWTANTYKTLLTVASGKGLVAGVIGPVAGGAETTTFEFTVDGILTEIAISVASGERASLFSGAISATPDTGFQDQEGGLNAGKTTLQTSTTDLLIAGHAALTIYGTPQLMFKSSLLIRAKHSQNITNSTATAYSGGIYRLGL